ncbi:MAG: PDDEXK nuclease domain-containing protein [Coriobacteriia bacterium]|nr:PDDEXK nuclease domain-containing protein [Coriobacteriia bacterium]
MSKSSQKEIALTESVHQSVRETLTVARQKVCSTVNSAMVEAYWEIGRQIYEAQGKTERAEYGKGLVKYLSKKLTDEFGKGFTVSSLHRMRKFYLAFPIVATVSPQLSWSHYCLLIRIDSAKRRKFYLEECASNDWSTRQLERQIGSHYYERLCASSEKGKASVRKEIHEVEPKSEPSLILKDPLVLDFLDLKDSSNYRESELEQALINKLQEFMLELGKGFAFVARQKRISSGGKHYYIDLVLYNFILKCFVLIDLKTGSLTHQDIRQIDFYRRIYDDLVKQENDNPTIGIVLSSNRDENIAHYSILSEKSTLLTTKYKLYLPTEEELQKEIERERLALEDSLH